MKSYLYLAILFSLVGSGPIIKHDNPRKFIYVFGIQEFGFGVKLHFHQSDNVLDQFCHDHHRREDLIVMRRNINLITLASTEKPEEMANQILSLTQAGDIVRMENNTSRILVCTDTVHPDDKTAFDLSDPRGIFFYP